MLTALRCGRRAAVVEVRGQHLELEVEDRFQQADLDQPALAGDAAADEAGQDALRQMSAGHHVGDGEAHRDGALVGVAAEPGQTGERLDSRSWPGLSRQGRGRRSR